MQGIRQQIYNIEQLCQLGDDSNYWLVENTIPRVGRTIVYGHGGTYKSTVIFDLCVAVASKGLLLRQFPICVHGPVLLISTESSKYRNRDRILSHLRAREAQSLELQYRGGKPPLPRLKDVQLFYCQQPFDLDDALELRNFEKVLEGIDAQTGQRPVLIVLDPLDSFLNGDENSAKETKRFRRAIDSIISTYETSVVVIHHSTKSTENPSIRGNSAWRGWTDTALFFQKRQTVVAGEQVTYVDVASDKQRDGPEGLIFSVIPEIDTVRGLTTFSIIADGLDPEAVTHNTVTRRIYEFVLVNQPCTQKDVMDGTGYSWKRVSAALQGLAADGVALQDAEVVRATSEDGSRTRRVRAWRIAQKISLVDSAAGLIRAEEAAKRQDEDLYDVDVVGPAPSPATHTPDVRYTFNLDSARAATVPREP